MASLLRGRCRRVFLQFKDNGQALGQSETKPGFNVGGGIEYFTGRTVSLKGEARYHVIGKRARRPGSVGPGLYRGAEEVLLASDQNSLISMDIT